MKTLSLIIDTAFDTCQVALAQGVTIIAEKREASGGGHDRVLAAMVRDLVSQNVSQNFQNNDASETPHPNPFPKGEGAFSHTPSPPFFMGERDGARGRLHDNLFQNLSQIIVTTGPGRFTGLRVGIAFARGLALVYKTPLVGVLTTDAIALDLVAKYPDMPNAVLITVKRGESFLQNRVPQQSTIDVIPDGQLLATLAVRGNPLLGGVISPATRNLLDGAGATYSKIADDIVEPSLDSILKAALMAEENGQGRESIVRPYYAANDLAHYKTVAGS